MAAVTHRARHAQMGRRRAAILIPILVLRATTLMMGLLGRAHVFPNPFLLPLSLFQFPTSPLSPRHNCQTTSITPTSRVCYVSLVHSTQPVSVFLPLLTACLFGSHESVRETCVTHVTHDLSCIAMEWTRSHACCVFGAKKDATPIQRGWSSWWHMEM